MRQGEVLRFSDSATGEPRTATVREEVCRLARYVDASEREIVVYETESGNFVVRDRTYETEGRRRRNLGRPDWRVYGDFATLRRALSLADDLERRVLDRLDKWDNFNRVAQEV